jgi:hypothetical protein
MKKTTLFTIAALTICNFNQEAFAASKEYKTKETKISNKTSAAIEVQETKTTISDRVLLTSPSNCGTKENPCFIVIETPSKQTPVNLNVSVGLIGGGIGIDPLNLGLAALNYLIAETGNPERNKLSMEQVTSGKGYVNKRKNFYKQQLETKVELANASN